MHDITVEKSQKSNTTLWILLASFLIPMFVAYAYFFWGERPAISSNGVLINPVIDIEQLKLRDSNGQLLDRERLTKKWRLYYFVGEHCDSSCQQTIFNMRQINKALGKNQSRLQYVIVHLQQPVAEFSTYLSNQHEDSIELYAQQIPQNSTNMQAINFSSSSDIYLMDPIGNIMMSFNKDLNPKLILKDINKLLKISRIG